MQRLNEKDLGLKPSEVFDIICRLGKGSYGSVYKARHIRTGETVAVKKVPVDSDLSDIVKEISIMQQCDSEYIVKYYGSYFDDVDLWICMEYCGAGSVSDIMRLRGRTLAEPEIAIILQYSLHGLEYLHALNKIHRDIKAGNILLNNDGHAKLADFGVAGQLSDAHAKRNTVIGTPYWMSPEVIQEIGYNCSADIWSLGITAIEMADGKPPYVDVHPMRALFMIPYSEPPTLMQPEKWSPAFLEFLGACLVKDPERRATARELLQFTFVKEAKSVVTLKAIIDEANHIRESRAAQDMSSMGQSSSRTHHRASQDGSSRVSSDFDTSTEEEGSESGTMIQRDSITSSVYQRGGSNGGASMTSVSRNSRSSATSSSVLGTMVINPTDDEEEGEGTLTSAHKAQKQQPYYLVHIQQQEAARQQQFQNANKDPGQENQRAGAAGLHNAFAPFQRAFQEGRYESLAELTYEELEKKLNSLESDLKLELQNLEIRYKHKRQPILDAIHEKTKQPA